MHPRDLSCCSVQTKQLVLKASWCAGVCRACSEQWAYLQELWLSCGTSANFLLCKKAACLQQGNPGPTLAKTSKTMASLNHEWILDKHPFLYSSETRRDCLAARLLLSKHVATLSENSFLLCSEVWVASKEELIFKRSLCSSVGWDKPLPSEYSTLSEISEGLSRSIRVPSKKQAISRCCKKHHLMAWMSSRQFIDIGGFTKTMTSSVHWVNRKLNSLD